MTIDQTLTPEVLAQNIQNFEKEGVPFDEVRTHYLEQGGSPALWERAEELIAAEKILQQEEVSAPAPAPSIKHRHNRKWLVLAVLLVLVVTAGWWAWTGLQKHSFDSLIGGMQQLVSPAETTDVVMEVETAVSVPEIEPEVLPEEVAPELEMEIETEITLEPELEPEMPTAPTQGVKRRPRPTES